MFGKDSSMKTLAIILLLLFALYTVLLVLKDSDEESSRPSFPPVKLYNDVCKSPECITLAHHLHNWRDISVDPCQDFYRAACGKYTEESLAEGGRLNKKLYIVVQLVQDFLHKNLPSSSKSENAMTLFYRKCEEQKFLNATEVRMNNSKEMLQMINRIGRWPIVDKLLSNMASLGFKYFGIFSVKTMSNFLIIDQDSSRLTISPVDIEKFLVSILTVNGIKPDPQSIQTDVKNILNFDKELAEIKSSPLNYLPLSELQQNISNVDFEKIIRSYMNPKRSRENWESIRNKTFVKVSSYFFNKTRNIDTILTKTPKRTIANYLIFRFILSLSEPQFPQTTNVKFNECALKVVYWFPLPSIRIFVRNYFEKGNLEIASNMVEDIKKSFLEVFEESTWLQDSTKQRAKKKVEMMRKVVGYPKVFEAPGALDKFFESLNLSENDSYFTIRAKVAQFSYQHQLDYIASLLPMDPDFRTVGARAYYKPGENLLLLSPGILDDPFIDSTFPKYAKIASIGQLIGHEIGHGFDPTGRGFDENGFKKDWWTPEDSAEYDRRAQCLIDKFNEYDDPVYRRNLNGNVTIGEIAADVIGLDLSWRNFKKVDLSKEPSIFGFEDENPDKLFFHLTALNWCSGKETMPLAERLTEPHPSHIFRVNGIFSNFKQFAKAFNCPVGSPMNPEKKCDLF
ncbi:hypothetical protein GCK72_020591 [Caenorhabditis remanei]|uniref:Peptidase M13 C-terminal domain-containing protein n=1 Tax=Caenorhabditis remanei TaxID=31234 RepID=A0A6A5GH69_CAERE|nr:hypothetical protein GCK72_020591 [Caenorhabditis remanei]KAF1754033.1 hypothetical protein GCK72_020591 [Caenorhabditis remanei]